MQLVHDVEGAGRSLVTLGVDSRDEVLAELEQRDIIPEPVIDGNLAATATITDPDGNRITIAELLPS